MRQHLVCNVPLQVDLGGGDNFSSIAGVLLGDVAHSLGRLWHSFELAAAILFDLAVVVIVILAAVLLVLLTLLHVRYKVLQHHRGTGDSRRREVALRLQRLEACEDGEVGTGDVDGGGAKLAARGCCRHLDLQLPKQVVQPLLLLDLCSLIPGSWFIREVVRVDDEALAISISVMGFWHRLHEHHGLGLAEVVTLGDELGVGVALNIGCSSLPDLDATQEHHRDGGGHVATRIEVDEVAVLEVGAGTRQVLGL